MGQILTIAYHLIDQSYPPAPSFNLSDIPDQTGVVSIVTGGSSGIGYEIVKVLLNKNGTVYVAARNKAKADVAIESIKKETGGKEPKFLSLDLTDLGSIENAVGEFLKKEKCLHVLYNNAGVMVPPLEALTPTGYDLQFGTNVLGPFYLTKLLLPIMQRTSLASGNKQRARVISCSSFVHMVASRNPALAFKRESFKGDTNAGKAARKKLGKFGLYVQSKLGVVVLAKELGRRYGAQTKTTANVDSVSGEVLSIAVNPGNLKTGLQRHLGGLNKYLTDKLVLHPAVYGAYAPIYASAYLSDKEAADIANKPASHGGYIIPWTRVGSAHACADDEKLREWLWDWLEEQVKERSFSVN